MQSCDQANADRFIRKSGQRDFVIYVGRHDPVKNPGEFVQLARAMPKQQFVMVGQNIDAETLRREYGQEPPANLYIHGPEDHAGVQDAIAASSAVVVTSFREGLPTLVLEAMAQGKPIVVPTEAGCREAIAEGDFGFIYEHGNVDDLARKTTAALAQKHCPEARQRVLKAYDWRVVAKELDHVYREPDVTIVEEQLTRWQQI